MRRVKRVRDLQGARFLLARRRMQRYMPRRPLRLLGFLVLGTIVGVSAVAAADAWDKGSRLQRGAVVASAALGFVIRDVEVTGRHQTSAEDVLHALGAARGTPTLAVQPLDARTKLQALPWVRSATVERHLPDQLVVSLVERRPMALWQHDNKIVLIDTDGKVVADADPGQFDDLLLVVGEDAPAHAQALLDTIGGEPELRKQVADAIWIGGRRWNVKLTDGVTIELPESNLGEAWSKLASIERGHSLLERNVEKVDLRLSDRVTVTPIVTEKPAAPPAKSRNQAKPT